MCQGERCTCNTREDMNNPETERPPTRKKQRKQRRYSKTIQDTIRELYLHHSWFQTTRLVDERLGKAKRNGPSAHERDSYRLPTARPGAVETRHHQQHHQAISVTRLAHDTAPALHRRAHRSHPQLEPAEPGPCRDSRGHVGSKHHYRNEPGRGTAPAAQGSMHHREPRPAPGASK